MNNGNLLNNLLGITSANAAASKTASGSARVDSNERFQQAFEQARPEIAARKPVARKESPVNEASSAARPAVKPVGQRHPQPNTSKTEPPPKTRTTEPDTTDKPQSAIAADADKPLDPSEQVNQSTDTQDQDEQTETSDATLFIDPTQVVVGKTNELLGSPEDLLNPDANSIATDNSAIEADAALLVLDGGPLLADSGLTPLAAVITEETADTVVGSSSALLSQVVSGLAASVRLPAGQPTTIQDGLAAVESDSLTLDVTAEGELSGDANAGENPDFLLLNSKALLNKLTEANITASIQGQVDPAGDVTKPAAGAAVESLLRLPESQSPAARAFVVQTGVPVAVGSPQWSQAVGDKVLWLAAQNVSAAEIRLDPPELGPMQVKVSINQDQASVTFTSPHPVVREALDQQLNRLREMFSEQGLNLVNVDVSDKSFAQQEREQQESAKHSSADLDEEELVPVGLTQAVSMRLVDHYA